MAKTNPEAEAKEKERRLRRRSFLRLTRLYKATSLDRLLTLHECTLEGCDGGFSHSQSTPYGYWKRADMIEAELTRRSALSRKPKRRN